MKNVWISLLLIGCTPSSGDGPTPSDSKAPQAPVDDEPARGRERADPCDPLPKQGDPCDGSQGYCVVDWGEPGGWSTALWCRDGKWEIENERNL